MGPKAERLRSLPLPLCTKDSKVHAHFVRTFAATVLGPPPGEGQGGRVRLCRRSMGRRTQQTSYIELLHVT